MFISDADALKRKSRHKTICRWEIFWVAFVCLLLADSPACLYYDFAFNGIKQSIQLQFDELNMNAFVCRTVIVSCSI